MDKFVTRTLSVKRVCDLSESDPESSGYESEAKHLKHQHSSGFSSEWLTEFPWLEEYDNGMRCKLCITHQRRPVRVAVGKAVWVDIPCMTLARDSIRKHAKSSCHSEAMSFEAERKKKGEEDKTASLSKLARVSAFRGLYWLVKREIAHTTNYLPLLDLLKLSGVNVLANMNKGDNDNGESMRFVSEALLTTGKLVQAPLLEGIRQSPFYSILIDETTDVQVINEMIVYVRYLVEGKSRTQFLRMIPLPNGTAPTIVTAITDLLSEINLPLQKMCALGSDGASVMLGRKNGVAAKLREMVPTMLSNHCVAHRLALATSQSARDISYLKTFKDVLDQLFRFYRNSPVRMAALKQIQTVMEDPKLKLQQAKDVRWLSHDNATRVLHKCLPSVITSLVREAEERNDTQAAGLSVFIQKYRFVASLLMMRDVLPPLAQLSRNMQTRDAIYTTVGPLVAGTTALLQQMQHTPGANFRQLDKTVEDLRAQNFNIRQPKDSEAADFKKNVYDKFLMNLIDNLDKRFPDLPVIQCYGAFDASCFPEDVDELPYHGNDDIQSLAVHFHLDQTETAEEWGQVKHVLKNEKWRPDQVMEYVVGGLQESHPNLYRITTIGLLLPTSTADCERGFSTLKRVKTTHRCNLSNNALNSLLSICMDGPTLDDFDFNRAVDDWHSQRTRRSSL